MGSEKFVYACRNSKEQQRPSSSNKYMCLFHLAQDKKDDLIVGVKSTALLFGEETKAWLAKFGGVMVSGLLLTGLMADQTLPYYLGVVATAGHLYWQVRPLRTQFHT